jgi:histidine triad (HIT) family protein
MSSDPSCIFCKIVGGQIPCMRVFETDDLLSFLDIGPLAEGHLLVIPKNHYERLEEMPPEAVAALTRHLPALGKALLQVTGAAGYNVLQNNGKVSGQEVMHVHFHLIPRAAGDGLGYRWNASKYREGRGEQLQKEILAALAGGAA